VIAFLHDEAAVFSALEQVAMDVSERWAVVRQAGDLAGRWSQLAPSVRRALLQHLVSRIDVGLETIALALRIPGIAVVADPTFDPALCPPLPREADEPIIRLSIAARLRRTGLETRLLIGGAGGPRLEPDRSLLRVLARVHQYRAMLLRSEGRTMAELAGEMGVSPSYFTRILKLSFLAPDIVQVILGGRHPLTLTAQSVTLHSGLPKAWSEQRELLGTA
jgi:site-specific DNA recombinase